MDYLNWVWKLFQLPNQQEWMEVESVFLALCPGLLLSAGKRAPHATQVCLLTTTVNARGCQLYSFWSCPLSSKARNQKSLEKWNFLNCCLDIDLEYDHIGLTSSFSRLLQPNLLLATFHEHSCDWKVCFILVPRGSNLRMFLFVLYKILPQITNLCTKSKTLTYCNSVNWTFGFLEKEHVEQWKFNIQQKCSVA